MFYVSLKLYPSEIRKKERYPLCIKDSIFPFVFFYFSRGCLDIEKEHSCRGYLNSLRSLPAAAIISPAAATAHTAAIRPGTVITRPSRAPRYGICRLTLPI